MSRLRDRRELDLAPSDWPPADLVSSLVRSIGADRARVGLVLGSGLGRIAAELEAGGAWSRRAEEIEGYPTSTAPGHDGKLLHGPFGGVPVFVVKGRTHLYEGYAPQMATRWVRLLHALGVRRLIVTNAAGALDSSLAPGSICLLADVVSLFFRVLAAPAPELRDTPWRRRSPLFDPALLAEARAAARELGIPLPEGVLAGSSGPAYETAAEVRAWRRCGGTVASMSTVPELLAARELGIRCVGFSLVTNLGTGLASTRLTHEEVLSRAESGGARLRELLLRLAARAHALSE